MLSRGSILADSSLKNTWASSGAVHLGPGIHLDFFILCDFLDQLFQIVILSFLVRECRYFLDIALETS